MTRDACSTVAEIVDAETRRNRMAFEIAEAFPRRLDSGRRLCGLCVYACAPVGNAAFACVATLANAAG